jgi:L-2,4-diaminobutyrate transaminase
MLGTGGIVPPPKGYWEKIQPILKENDILIIADEVVTGFGRLGKMFGSDFYQIDSDIITIAKGLTSAYAPLSGSIFSEKIWEVLEKGTDEFGPIGHGWTYSAHPICAAAGVANLELIDQMKILDNVNDVGPYFNTQLKEKIADLPHVGEVRSEGLIGAIELVEDKKAHKFFDPSKKFGPTLAGKLLSNGVIARAMPQGDILGLAPPLCISKAEVDIVNWCELQK